MSQADTWTERLKRNPERADGLLMVASFLETIIVPIPIELVLIPYMIGHRKRVWWTATVVLAGCVAAALVGYGVGAVFMQSIGQWVIEAFGWQQDKETFTSWFGNWGFWAIVAIGVVPVPFQVAMLTAGAAGYPILMFVLAALLARGIRYYGLALLVHLFGERALRYWKANSTKAAFASVLAVALVAGVIIAMT